ncbi:cysteine dioxygenase family protein [[Mycobacterium] kokjensenii]|uniref:Cysteine dioxygenase family protein n=1 Tax=[Mycobacterium] kokjensenii TaxID=3064287 RepID=A0ABM9L914_9MYCO|nr:cysteine dioxygenase family protein [Mycolicibacter sp. MU0083]CAJ1494850.1 cysteine dioxygenase family protein [Mycolicibacter sp. MU0083]
MAIAEPIALRRPTVGGRTLRRPDLLQITDLAAEEVLRGRYDHLLPATGLPDDERWFARIHGDDRLDIWLISWVPGHATELHDHGESLGALTVLSGALDEFHWDGDRLARRRLDAGDQAAFSRGWVHDVVWAPSSNSAAAEPAAPTLSVHAYSPPLFEMSYYDVAPDNTLRRQRTELTEHPEAS